MIAWYVVGALVVLSGVLLALNHEADKQIRRLEREYMNLTRERKDMREYFATELRKEIKEREEIDTELRQEKTKNIIMRHYIKQVKKKKSKRLSKG